ncbi:fimbrial protein [Escherichia coli]
MKIKNLLAGMVLLGTSTFAGNIWAADWGPCQTSNGVAHEYSFDFVQTIQVPSENKAGKILTQPFALGTKYSAYCECPDPIPDNGVVTYFKGVTLLPEPGTVDGYYKFNNYNDSQPMANVSISGSITVTQGCELAAGTVLDIPFGEYQAHDFKGRAGQPPQNVQKVQKELSFDCNNISDGVKIYLSIDATPNTAYPSAIDLGNADVGAVIEDGKGNILKPNDSNSLLEMNPGSLYEDVKRKATTTITAYPVSTTGKLPAAGDYSGIATIHVELE